VRDAPLRRVMRMLRRTPLHPQWLLGGDAPTVRWIKAEARGRVLDIGCADRWVESQLPDTCEYLGLDYPDTGRDLYGARPDVFADARKLPLADASVDTVLILEVMEHLQHPADALAEIARVLRPDGKLLLSMPFLYPIHDAPHDFQRLTRFGLMRDTAAAGLRVEMLCPSLDSSRSTGLIACIACAGMALESIRRRAPGMILVPFLLAAVPVINVISWLASILLPSWDAVTNGYRLVAIKK
jgi:SAM-dependent methyltransferase